MFIAKIVIPSTWTKVEDLIKETTGDNSFAFSSNKYLLQAEADPQLGYPILVADDFTSESSAYPNSSGGIIISLDQQPVGE